MNNELIDTLIQTVRHASREILLCYKNPKTKVFRKKDGSFVTEADHKSEEIILNELVKLTPSVAIVSEENCLINKKVDVKHGHFWCVDPLDGTSGFVEKNDMFCISIGLIYNFRPILGIIAHPSTGQIWTGVIDENNKKYAFKYDAQNKSWPISVENYQKEKMTALVSPHMTRKLRDYLEKNNIKDYIALGSALKFCKLAEGIGNFYSRLSPSYEWDTAAGEAILIAAGGSMSTLTGETITYGKEDFVNEPFIAYGKKLNES